MTCGQPQTWKRCGEDWASPAPENIPLLQLLCAVDDNPFPHISWDSSGSSLSFWAAASPVWHVGSHGSKASGHHRARRGLLPSWTCTSSGKAECALHVLRIPEENISPEPNEAIRRVRSPCLVSSSAPHTPPKAEKPQLGPGCVLGMFPAREGLPGSCAGRAPQTPGPDSQQLLYSSFCFFHLCSWPSSQNQKNKTMTYIEIHSAGQCCLTLILVPSQGHVAVSPPAGSNCYFQRHPNISPEKSQRK